MTRSPKLEGTKMSDSLRDAQSNPAFKLVAWVATTLFISCVSMATFIFTTKGMDDKEGRAELAKSIDGLRGDIQTFNRSLHDQQMTVTLLQSRVTAVEARATATADSLSKVRDDVNRDGFRIDRIEDVITLPKQPRR